MSGVFSGNQWTTASGSTWRVVIEPDFVNQVRPEQSMEEPLLTPGGLPVRNQVAELCNHLSLASQEARAECEKLVEQAQQASEGSESNKKEVVKSVVGLAQRNGLNAGAESRGEQQRALFRAHRVLLTDRLADIEGFANLAATLVEQYFAAAAKDASNSSQEAEQLLTSLSSAVSKPQSSESAAATSARYSS